MNYVVLHIDLEFIVGAVCADNGNSYPITNGNDDLLWLYFYNDPRSNRITYGKSNRDNANKEVTNYYGKFFNIITDGHTTFKRGEFQKDAIELLQYSDLLKTVKDKYVDITKESTENIHILITFSLSISDLAKQKTVEYLKTQGFQIDSYTIPLAELVCYYPYSKKNFLPANGSTILLLAATNATLHLMKLVFSDNYFMLDGKVKKYEGMGIDPRKRALVGYVINQINVSVGALNTNEIPAEIEKKEFKADEWLKKIDAKAKNDNSPVRISESLSPMPSSTRDVLVKKSDIETFTNDFVNLLMDYFNAYKNDNISGDIAGIFLLGDCFNNSLVKQRFNNLFRDDDERKKKLFTYNNKEIQDILSVYPRIDFKRYINKEERSKAKAEAEEKKIAEQRAIDAAKEAEAKAERAKIEAEKKAEENRKEAQKLFERAVELEKEGKLEDALANVESAISLDGNAEYRRFLDALRKKIKELNDKTDKYKSWYKDAESYEQSGELTAALEAYKEAQALFDSDDLRKKIVKLKNDIEKQVKSAQVDSFISIAIALSDKDKFEEAVSNINKALEIDPANQAAKEAMKQIYTLQTDKETEKKYKEIINKADTFFKEQNFDKAVAQYNEAFALKKGDKYCTDQITKIKDLILQKQNKEKADKIVAEADIFFEKELFEVAKTKYEEALILCRNDKNIQSKIKDCRDKIKAIEIKFKDLIFDADTLTKDGKIKQTLSKLEEALRLQPDNKEIIEKINKLKKKLEFENDFGKTNTGNNNTKLTSTKEEGSRNTQKIEKITRDVLYTKKVQNTDDDFLGSTKKKTITETSEIKKAVDDDDFLKKK
ncbi:MAG: hypothetical protein LBC89_05975 [Bacteroidales bacterium]|jgi:tetratricopeptide (TPR) repeat protein|nr:hypothetical protein [Bacteroidales bacterium]